MAVGYRLKKRRLRRRNRERRNRWSEYHSNTLRDLAQQLEDEKPIQGRMYANIFKGAANRIDELQHRQGHSIEYIARLWDENYKLKKEKK